uniref:interferon gamma receptor 2 n=1 Tax=Euleptes europaea TaxID=460621 RepID=UPI002541CAD0|nr:interferon gamma receptor 2 [Euleptes europaea]
MLGLGLPLLLFLSRGLLETAAAESSFLLPAPQNVSIVSYNFQSTLKWSPVVGINNSAVSYRVDYQPTSFDFWIEVNSKNITKSEYDFTNDIKEHVKVTFRVRTEQGELKSDWVKTSPFRAGDQTILGPPREIDATVKANSILVSYKAPFDNNSTFFAFLYSISYWEKLTNKDPPPLDKMAVVNTRNTKYKLANLMEMTEYCFHILAMLPEKGLQERRLSDTYCRKTSITETTKILWITLPIISVVVLLVIIFFCLTIMQKHQNIIKSLWRPPLTIPSHYEEDLQNPHMNVVQEFKNCAGEDHWDSVSVISSVEQNSTMTNSTDCNNQEVHLLETDHFAQIQ